MGEATNRILRDWALEKVHGGIAVNAKDGSLLVWVPPGEFEMGEGSGAHRVELSGYWIGVYAVTNTQYRRFVEATKHRAPNNTRGGDQTLADHPVASR